MYPALILQSSIQIVLERGVSVIVSEGEGDSLDTYVDP